MQNVLTQTKRSNKQIRWNSPPLRTALFAVVLVAIVYAIGLNTALLVIAAGVLIVCVGIVGARAAQ